MIKSRHKFYVIGGGAMYKRISLRLTDELAEEVKAIAKKRGLSVNALVAEMTWNFIQEWKRLYAGLK